MFSSLFRQSSTAWKKVNIPTIRRFASSSTKQEKAKSALKLAVVLGVSGPVCYTFYSYATDYRFRVAMNEKYLIHAPWFLKKFDKWFPMNTYAPYTIRRVNMPYELKEALSKAFTDMDAAKPDGMMRSDATEFMAIVLEGAVPEEIVTKLYNGDYLNAAIADFKIPNRHALAGAERTISIDEFIAFCADILRESAGSIAEKQQSVESACTAFKTKHMIHDDIDKIEGLEEMKENLCPPLLMPIVRSVIYDRYNIDTEGVDAFNDNKERIETRNERRSTLQNDIEVLQWDINQAYEEIKEEKKYGGEDSKEIIADLYEQIADMNKELKEKKNELYYL